MSCNGCRVLRRRCSDNCTLRACLDGIDDPRAQGNATLFVSKFFGRSDLMAFISAVPENRRPACGRTVNPVTGAVGLLSTGNWHVCQKAVETVLVGGNLRPVFAGILTPTPYMDETFESFRSGGAWDTPNQFSNKSGSFIDGSDHTDTTEWVGLEKRFNTTSSIGSETELSDVSLGLDSGNKEPKLLNLFV
ncbi:PREDICTED: LOB domain-containing protein 38-like isoform X2 [Nicotiana attenuata]|uniref:LOB domain-containing protein 38-like isoform X2 n=1 Tax=Nicotiana attenuata TaxID=49451 RepID=UPI0009048251|nr:PREDICTED: LOB domain-containing protein 38-like isoform X2 [Nicotiana attenuata]